MLKEALSAVKSINSDIYDILGDEGCHYDLSIRTNGHDCVVTFLGNRLWCSEDDGRPETDEEGTREPMRVYLLKALAVEVDLISKLKELYPPSPSLAGAPRPGRPKKPHLF